MNSYPIHCPSCQQSYEASDEHAGAQTQCQSCQSYFSVPTRQQAVALTRTSAVPVQAPQPLDQTAAQAPVVPVWYKTLTVMLPLCASVLLIGGGAVYWIINNKTVSTETNNYQTEVVKETAPPAASEREKKIASKADNTPTDQNNRKWGRSEFERLNKLRAKIEEQDQSITVPFNFDQLVNGQSVFTPLSYVLVQNPVRIGFNVSRGGNLFVAIRCYSHDFGVVPISKCSPRAWTEDGKEIPYRVSLRMTAVGNYAMVFELPSVPAATRVYVEYSERFLRPKYPALDEAPRDELSKFENLFPRINELAKNAGQVKEFPYPSDNRFKLNLCDARATAFCSYLAQSDLSYSAEYLVGWGVPKGANGCTHAAAIARNGKYVAFVDPHTAERNRVVGSLQHFIPTGVSPSRTLRIGDDTLEGFGNRPLLAYLQQGTAKASRLRFLRVPHSGFTESQATTAESEYIKALMPLVEASRSEDDR